MFATFTSLEVLIICTTNCWTIVHRHFADQYIKTEALFEEDFYKCLTGLEAPFLLVSTKT